MNLRLTFAAIAAMTMAAPGASAAVYVETTDAGQTVTTASTTLTAGTPQSLTSIGGTLGYNDADLFRIYISNPAAFSASTVAGTDQNLLDTVLFLFDLSGHAIATNDDDASGLTLNSTLPVGNALYAKLPAGTYLLGISNSGNEPVNSANQLLFARSTTGATTEVRGAASGLNPTTEFNFDSRENDGNVAGASYRIDLTGVTTGPAVVAAVPEAATWAMLLAGVGVVGGTLRRRRVTTRVRFA